jgi:adenosylcobinamide hydrolase
MEAIRIRLVDRVEAGWRWPVLHWEAGPGRRAISSAPLGGGLRPLSWWLNCTVNARYDRQDPRTHLKEIATELGLTGPGCGMLTAVDVAHHWRAEDGGVQVVATVGLGLPVPAAAGPDRIASEQPLTGPGTINLLAVLPVPLGDAALVNTVVTATESKSQALAAAGIEGTGTASDAVCIACPIAGASPFHAPEPYAGPRSTWGSRLARAVFSAVGEGTAHWRNHHR